MATTLRKILTVGTIGLAMAGCDNKEAKNYFTREGIIDGKYVYAALNAGGRQLGITTDTVRKHGAPVFLSARDPHNSGVFDEIQLFVPVKENPLIPYMNEDSLESFWARAWELKPVHNRK